jgi:hypothetical protein
MTRLNNFTPSPLHPLYSSRMGKPTRHLVFSQNCYCAFMHPILKIKLSRITWPCMAGSIVLVILVKILILLKTEFANFEICYILTIGTENSDFCLPLGARCVALGLYMML